MIIKIKTSIITCRHFSVIGYFNCSWPEQLTIYVVEFVWAHNLSYPVDRHCVLYNIPGKLASPVFRQHASYSFLDLKKYTKEINLCALKKEKVFRYHKWCRWSTASRYLEAYFIAVWNDHDRKFCWMLTMCRYDGKLSKTENVQNWQPCRNTWYWMRSSPEFKLYKQHKLLFWSENYFSRFSRSSRSVSIFVEIHNRFRSFLFNEL